MSEIYERELPLSPVAKDYYYKDFSALNTEQVLWTVGGSCSGAITGFMVAASLDVPLEQYQYTLQSARYDLLDERYYAHHTKDVAEKAIALRALRADKRTIAHLQQHRPHAVSNAETLELTGAGGLAIGLATFAAVLAVRRQCHKYKVKRIEAQAKEAALEIELDLDSFARPRP